ncbi:hypothetical protein OEZ85_007710 [Tetradesmus obliquus]|uniref:Replication protein A C-terminal domain-containing protein n=1 Tax=Tetradesmus obliquus TaxID=3088 RepID=A0ABY8TII8_TETOB|nr:hypothetical protein OEZ85_007710 [Tetradesmus obliquus]
MFGGGGFGGDAGNQFAGGGFMPSQAPAQDGYGGGSGGGRAGNSKQTLRTLTIRQLAKAANGHDDVLRADNSEITNVTVIGKILSVRDANMTLTLTITDGTGTVDVDHFLSDSDDGQVAAQKKAEWSPGVYVRVFGHARCGNDQVLRITGFNVRTITDFNEVTYYFLRCIFEHVHLTKGGAAGQGMGGAAAGGMAMGGAAAAGGWQGGGAPQQATAFAGAAAGNGMDPCSNAVLQIIQGSNSEAGCHVQEIYSKLAGQFGQHAIDNALHSLTSEAHLYTTTDDNHYRAA